MFRMDACRFCRCQGGVSVCFTAQCGILHCERYYVPEGECCPVCEDPIYPVLNFAGCYVNGEILAHGDHWREDDCTFCQCVSGDARCVAAACGHSCLNPVTVPGECCPVCEGEELCSALISDCTLKCPFGLQTDAHGCDVCQCRPRPKKCKAVVSCPMGFQQDELGCLKCQCRVKMGSCLSMDGRQHENGENWHDGCRDCYCHSGREMCTLISCPVPACDSPAIWDGQCCPSCPEEPSSHKPDLGDSSVCLAPGGEYFVEGETWNIDACTQCTCHSGRVLCETEVCPPLLCQSPIRTQDSCCPHCPDEPITPQSPSNDSMPSYCRNEEGDIFLAAESWKPNTCSSCVCLDGQISCFSESCPPVGCARPVLRKGQCCPYCLGTDPLLYCQLPRPAMPPTHHSGGQLLPHVCRCVCMYAPAPTNVPIEKTDQHGDRKQHQPVWPTRSENDIMPQFRGDFGSLQMPYLDGKTPVPSEDTTLHSVAWVALPIVMMLFTITALLYVNQKKQWIPPTCLNNQLVYVGCQKGTKVQVDSSQRMLRIADPDSRYSGYYSMQKQNNFNNLQADNFYQTQTKAPLTVCNIKNTPCEREARGTLWPDGLTAGLYVALRRKSENKKKKERSDTVDPVTDRTQLNTSL
ncbi:unnamed protein product, partial [Coregonus sp. 'balchen']